MSDDASSLDSLNSSRSGDSIEPDNPGAPIQAVGITYIGPLPPPAVLREFEEILPGSAERLFAQFELEGQHRRLNETRVIESNVWSQKLGTASASLIGLSGVAGGIWLVSRGQSLSGLGTVFMALGSIVGTFLYKRRSHHQDLDGEQRRSSQEE